MLYNFVKYDPTRIVHSTPLCCCVCCILMNAGLITTMRIKKRFSLFQKLFTNYTTNVSYYWLYSNWGKGGYSNVHLKWYQLLNKYHFKNCYYNFVYVLEAHISSAVEVLQLAHSTIMNYALGINFPP